MNIFNSIINHSFDLNYLILFVCFLNLFKELNKFFKLLKLFRLISEFEKLDLKKLNI